MHKGAIAQSEIIPASGVSLPSGLSRREFLKMVSAAAVGTLIPFTTQQVLAESPVEEHGRVLDEKISLYNQPSFNSKQIGTHWKDTLLPIHEITIGDSDPPFNRIWYYTGEGYVHSGSVQPVAVKLNTVPPIIPAGGALAEVTVPFTDAHWGVGKSFSVAYRLYYETTHWVVAIRHDREGYLWYELAEDKWKLDYYVPAEHLRLIPAEELLPLSFGVPAEAKRIEVLTQHQAVVAYEFGLPVYMAKTATGAKFSNGDFSTPPGRHVTAHKRPSRHMAAGNLAFNGYDLPGVPWISYITESGISFHGTYWHNNFGRPRSHGCINMTAKAAKWIYLWTHPTVPPDQQFAIQETGTIIDVV